jgi:hypothetical protein
MFATLHQTGFHAMISVWGRFDTGSANFNALQAGNDLLTPSIAGGRSYYYGPFKAEPGRSIGSR